MNTTLFALPNLGVSEVTRIDWEGEEPPERATPTFKSKDEYRKWCADARTSHAFVTGLEGLTPGLRVTAQNPPVRLWTLIGEYDAAFAPALGDVTHAPTWTVRSFSGNGRALWAFEEPLPVDATLLREFCKVAFKHLRAKRLAAGFEPEESARPGQHFEIGEWSHTGGVLPRSVTWGWAMEAATNIRWDLRGIQIPFEKVREEASKRFGPTWPGGWDAFTPGARGTRFWESGADAMSVIATETGCVAFTGDKPFLSWSDIFGASWVEEQHGGMIGQAISSIWFDEKANTYYREKPDGNLAPVRKEDLVLHLRMLGISHTPPKGQSESDVDKALWTIQMHRSVQMVVPLIFRKERLVGGKLNISRVEPLLPVEHAVAWGEGFPWLARYFTGLFDSSPTEGQLLRFLSWWGHFYRNAIEGVPTVGMALSIAGPNSIGKNFLGNAVLGPMVGGHGDASRYLCGEDQFNSQLMDCPLWTLHDAVMSGDPKAREKFSQNLKRAVANREVHARAMYREGVDIQWCGRVLTTMNEDPDSLRMLPNLEQTIRDKLLLLKAFDPKAGRFPNDAEVARELPFFGAYLRDLEIPEAMRNERFGVQHWHHPELVEASQVESPTQGAYEILSHWREHYFSGVPDKEWEGTATQLFSEMVRDPELAEVARRQFRTCNSVGNAVSKLIGQGVEWLQKGRGTGHLRERVIRILR